MKCISFFYIELAHLKEERWKKETEEENQPNWDFRPILERLDSKRLEIFDGTSSIAQWRSQLSQL